MSTVEAKPAVEKILSLEEILSSPNIEYKTVKAFGGTIRIASLNSDEVIDWLEGQKTPEQRKDSSAKLLAASLVDADGNRIGLGPDGLPAPAVVAQFRKKGHADMEKAVREIVKLNGLTFKGEIAPEVKNG